MVKLFGLLCCSSLMAGTMRVVPEGGGAMFGSAQTGSEPSPSTDEDSISDDQSAVLNLPSGENSPSGTASHDAESHNAETASIEGLTQHHTDAYAHFDPAIHATDANGNPILTARGTLAKKRGRKAGSGNAADSVLRAPAGEAAPSGSSAHLNEGPRAVNPIVFKHAGRAAAQLTVGTSAMLFGPAWYLNENNAQEKDEYNAMSAAYAAYFQAHGIADIPPGYMLAMVLAAYAAPRVSDPETLTRFQRIALGAKNLWAKVRSFRKA